MTVIQILHGGLVRVAAEGFVMDVKGDFSVGDELLLSGDVPVKKLSQTNVVHYR